MTNPWSPAQRRCASSHRQVNAWVAVGQRWETVERTSRARQPNVTRRHSDGSEWAETAAVRKSENGERTHQHGVILDMSFYLFDASESPIWSRL
jgi:hypothetical protein